MKKILFAVMFPFMLTGCGAVYSYDASIHGPSGRYEIVGRRGALIEATFPDGANVRADDRGHPDQPSALANMASVAGAALINRSAD